MSRPPHWPQPWPDIDATLTAISDGLAEANVDQADEGTFADLARRLFQLDATVAALTGIAAQIEEALIDRMDEDEMELPGFGWVARSAKSPRTKWRHPDAKEDLRRDLAAALARDFASDPITGEVPQQLRRLVDRVVEAVAEAISMSYPKRSLRRFGLDIEDYVATEAAGFRIALVGPEGVS